MIPAFPPEIPGTRSRFRPKLSFLSAAALISVVLASCGGNPDLDAEPSWAINWGSVIPNQDGLEGYHVWEFYVDGWEKHHEDEYFKCSIAQELHGDSADCPDTDVCPGCVAAYTLELTLMESDCPDYIQGNPSYLGPTRMAIGDVPAELSDADPYPSFSLGWYIGFSDQGLDAHGYAYPEALESDQAPSGQGWNQEETFILWPAYAWDLLSPQ